MADIYIKYYDFFFQNGLNHVFYKIRYYEVLDTPLMDSNTIHTIYLKFVNEREYYVTWNLIDFQLCMDILFNELIFLNKNVDNLKYKISVNNVNFFCFSEQLLQYISDNKCDTCRITFNKPVSKFSRTYLRVVSYDDSYNPVIIRS